MSNKIYDILKWVAIVVLPALATLVTVVFKIWSLPFGVEISQTITAIAAFLGAILAANSINYIVKNNKETTEE